MKRSDFVFTVLLPPADFVMLLTAAVATYLLRTEILSAFRPVLFEFNLPLVRYVAISALASLGFIAAFAVVGLYSFKRLRLAEEFGKIVVGCSAGILAVIMYIFLRQELFDSRFLILGGWFFAIAFVTLGRSLVRLVRRRAVARWGFGVHRLVIVGADETARALAAAIEEDAGLGYRVVARCDRPDLAEIQTLAEAGGVDEVMVADPNFPPEDIVALVDFCNERHLVFKFIPNIYQTLTANAEADTIARRPVIELKRTPLDGWGRVAKRGFDVVASFFGLIFLSPLFAVMATAIKWDTPGPVFARLKRVSKNKQFVMYKFRSMISTDPDGTAHSLNSYFRSLGNDRPDAGPLWKMRDDPRITRVGKFIRRWRLDELGQLINILRGEMSLVGPRPHQPDEIARYAKHHKRVLAVKAGATGLAQASGSSELPFEEEVKLDTFYIENWSLWLDMKILFKTLLKVLSRDRGAV